jgi:hypothetical protein
MIAVIVPRFPNSRLIQASSRLDHTSAEQATGHPSQLVEIPRSLGFRQMTNAVATISEPEWIIFYPTKDAETTTLPQTTFLDQVLQSPSHRESSSLKLGVNTIGSFGLSVPSLDFEHFLGYKSTDA